MTISPGALLGRMKSAQKLGAGEVVVRDQIPLAGNIHGNREFVHSKVAP
jgi:hypothetical protein